MKKFYFLIVSIFMSTVAFAQEPVKFGVKAGLNFASQSVSFDGDEDVDSKSKPVTTFHLGAYADISISDVFSVQPGLSLSGKGSRSEYSDSEEFAGETYTYSDKETTNIMYVEIPVNAIYKFNNFYIGAGPYAAFAISGKYKSESTVTEGAKTESSKEEEDIKFGSGDEDSFKSTDFGLNLMAGYQLPSGLNFGLGYGFGLANIASHTENNYSVKNKVLSISVGFSF